LGQKDQDLCFLALESNQPTEPYFESTVPHQGYKAKVYCIVSVLDSPDHESRYRLVKEGEHGDQGGQEAEHDRELGRIKHRGIERKGRGVEHEDVDRGHIHDRVNQRDSDRPESRCHSAQTTNPAGDYRVPQNDLNRCGCDAHCECYEGSRHLLTKDRCIHHDHLGQGHSTEDHIDDLKGEKPTDHQQSLDERPDPLQQGRESRALVMVSQDCFLETTRYRSRSHFRTSQKRIQ
jgi:hypothetical protein